MSVLKRCQGEALAVLGAPMLIKSDGAANGVFVAEHIVEPGQGVPLHVHERDEEMFYILEGELTLEDETGERRAGAGCFVSLPPGVPHAFRNAGAEDARFLVITCPGLAAAEMFRHLDRAGSPPPQEIGAIAAQYGVRMEGLASRR
ncbi:MAG: cupin domain-containing protein [Reyranellaceae bacterium]